ncbi:MAG TPA: MerR family transcriptional regulator [Clostridia bacterium]|nr:MerR family transcriptional regulator [Clostridia bacterium]
MKTVSQVSKLAGISVRTLHYYDQIGLLSPETAKSGYRLYSDADLEKLWRILFYRELEFPLEQIRKILSHPSYNRDEALRGQRLLLVEKKRRLENLIASIDQTLKKGFEVKLLKTFDKISLEEHKKIYAREAREKYGKIYEQSEEKTSQYSEDRWNLNMKQAQSIFDGLAACMEQSPDSPEVQTLIGKWRAHITENYYECTPEILEGLGKLYLEDERFTRNINKTRPGLAEFLSRAIGVYCRKLRG